MTNGGENCDESAGSDSEPSEDNLEEEEMAKIIPIKVKKKPADTKNQKKKSEPIKVVPKKNIKDPQKSPTSQ